MGFIPPQIWEPNGTLGPYGGKKKKKKAEMGFVFWACLGHRSLAGEGIGRELFLIIIYKK